jgi:hypothetical protein
MSTLAMTYANLRSAIGDFLGYGTDSSAWDTQQTTDINNALASGLRRFYTPMVMPGEGKAHQWSFLRPKYSFDTVAADFDYDLPAGFAQIIGPIDFDNSENQNHRIKVTGEANLMALRARDTTAGAPIYAAVRAKAQTAGSEQISELIFWPTPDVIYTLHFRYQIQPDNISSSNTYPYGGAAHTETILAACKAAAEETKDDAQGIWGARFMERLQASIAYDRSANGPEFFGYNGDKSVNDPEDDRTWHVTYGGVLPD